MAKISVKSKKPAPAKTTRARIISSAEQKRLTSSPGKMNPSPRRSTKIANAVDLYKNFTGQEPEFYTNVKKPELPDVAFVIGPMVGVSYEATRDGITETYYHEFDKNCRPLLASTHDGRTIFILGGEYDFTEDGIVDRVPKTGRRR